jgi:hypothetical protein
LARRRRSGRRALVDQLEPALDQIEPSANVIEPGVDRLLDFIIATWLGLLDRLAPLPETEVDRAIREEGEGLRKAFPTNNLGARRIRSQGLRK